LNLVQWTAGNGSLKAYLERPARLILPHFVKPEYLFRPRQAGRRAWHQIDKGRSAERLELPWGTPVVIDPRDNIGKAVWTTGVYDLVVAEALFRLTDKGELALDVGSNVGLMSSALACAVGQSGHVLSFEPNPKLLPRLHENIELWRSQLGWNHVTVAEVALSATNGEAQLTMRSDFAENNGLATLEAGWQGESVTVRTTTLDSFLTGPQYVGTMKLDVEGHEESVLVGSHNLLSSGRVRDVVFEDHDPYPTTTMRLLEAHGYEIFRLRKGMFGPLLTPGVQRRNSLSGDPPSYVATRDAPRATSRFSAKGWRALRRG
jgi:FkbM family methyltransferase